MEINFTENTDTPINEKQHQSPWTKRLILSCILVTASASLSNGFGIGSFAALKDYFPINLSTSSTFVQGSIQTVFLIGNMIGAFTTTYWYRFSKINRKSIFYINYVFLFASIAFALLSMGISNIVPFYISRIVHGYQTGMSCVIVPTYITDISPKQIRGSTGFLHQLLTTIGILLAQTTGLKQLFGNVSLWAYSYIIGAIPSFIAIFLLHKIPDSPYELFARYHNENAAIRTVKGLTNKTDVSGEIDEIKKEIDETSKIKNMSIKNVWANPKYRWPAIISITLLSVQALSGINAVLFYYEEILKTSFSDKLHLIPILLIVTGFVNVGATVVSSFIVEKVGRRPLILYSMAVIVVSFIAVIASIETASKIAATIFILVFIIAFAVALGPIPFLFASEAVRQEFKESVLKLGLILNYAFNILLTFFFPLLTDKIGSYVFIIFIVVVALGAILFWFKMPETKNKTIDEIESYKRGKR